jgi:RNA polymerase sigma factor (sigma-70 family)
MKDIVTNEELVKLYRAGDPSALEALCLQNYNLIRQTVSKLCKYQPEMFEDEMQEAFLALLVAVNKYQEDSGSKLATYIVNEIEWSRKNRYRYRSRHDVIDTVSLDKPLPGESTETVLSDTISDPNSDLASNFEKEDIRQRLKTVLSDIVERLPNEQKTVIKARLEDKSLQQIARERGEREIYRVRQIEQSAFNLIKSKENIEKLQEFIDFYNLGYKHTGYRFWKETGYSSVEWAVELKERNEKRWIKKGG